MTTTKTLFRLKNFIFILIFPLIIGISGCSNSDDNDVDKVLDGDCDQVYAAVTAFSEAVTDFQQAPSETACNNLRSSALEFIEVLQDCQQYSEQYGDLEETAEAYRNLDCSEL